MTEPITSTYLQVIPANLSTKGVLILKVAKASGENPAQRPDWFSFWKIIALGCQRRLEEEARIGGANNGSKASVETTADNSRILSPSAT